MGTFDGVHLGHRAILRRAREVAATRDADVVAVAFDPHPASVLAPERQPPRLCSRERKRELLLGAGADRVEIVEPTRELLGMGPRVYVEELVERHVAVGFVEGDDFRFGKGRVGDVELLEKMGRELGFDVHVVEPVRTDLRSLDSVVVSSSLIRWLVGRGRVRDAAGCLGAAFEMTATVVRGERRGRTIGIPTANLDPADYADHSVPADGVYAGVAIIGGTPPPACRLQSACPEEERTPEFPAAISIGTKPAFDGRSLTIEAHLLNYPPPPDGDAGRGSASEPSGMKDAPHPDHLYGHPLTLRFTRFLRDQYPYPSLDPLLKQIHRDIDNTAAAVA